MRDGEALQGGADAAGELPVLKALLRIAEAVARADYFDDVLEVVAEQARAALNAASVSISRWEPEEGILRTLINVGDLAGHEQRWPADEFYLTDAYARGSEMLHQGRSYTHAIDDPNCPPASARLLAALGKESELAVPVMYGDRMWGELWATGTDGRRFDHGDTQLLQAIAAHAAVAVGRSELLSTVWSYALEDPLTGIANRRAADSRFAELDWDTATPVLLLCDLDGFKKVNDRDGHPAGDELLRRVAATLSALAAEIDGALAARLGGDEFCVLLPDATLAAAQTLAADATRALSGLLAPGVTVSWGAAAAGTAIRSGAELMAAADAALREAKRQGPARFSTGVSVPTVAGGQDRSGHAGTTTAVARLPRVVVEALRDHPDITLPAALAMLAEQVQHAIDGAAWAISESVAGTSALHTVRSIGSVRLVDSGLTVLTDLGPPDYDLDEFPLSAQVLDDGTWFIAGVDLDGSDPAETALLRELGYQAVLAVGVRAGHLRYLLEFFSHDGHQHLVDIAPLVQVLAGYCVATLHPAAVRAAGS
ncbi:diguanylate cyclase domain-containing protein [Mycolicibacterium vaccae]|uniref:diguanylate cyclase domain-containing protein n=1 Tax=Mycolicibacterium vaccae TaxID=1810 RepID=UPI003CFB0A83